MASKKRKAGTLLERHGFKDPDAGTPVHDGVCAWLDKNMATVCGGLFPQHKGTITVEEKIWEKPIHKSHGGYDGRQSSAVVGFADMFVKAKWTHTDVTRWREVDAGVLAWVEDPAAFKANPQFLRKFEKLDWKHVNGHYYPDHSDDDAGFAALAAAGVHARVRANFKETDHVEGCHRFRLVDSKVLHWADDSCIDVTRQTYENGVAGWYGRQTLKFGGLRKYYMKKTEETVTCPKGVDDLLAGLGTVHKTAFATVRGGTPPADTDDVRRKVTSRNETIVFEAKSAIPSLGDILRELQFYKEHATYNTKLVVVCHDDTHAPTIREQGFLFYQCPDLGLLAKVQKARGIGRYFAAPSKRKRACHPDSITVRTEDGASRVCVYGICPKCGTGSGYLEVPAEHVHNSRGPHSSCLTVDKCSIDTTCALETCEHQYRVHV